MPLNEGGGFLKRALSQVSVVSSGVGTSGLLSKFETGSGGGFTT